MTTIAFDGTTLAGDRQRTEFNTATRCRKVFRVKANDGRRFLVGCAGDSDDCVAMLLWMRGKAPQPAPKSLHVISIDEKGRIWTCGEKLVWYRIGGFKYWAIGSGSDYALGAMACGKSARDAVRVAIKHDNSTGLGVDMVRF